MRKILPSSTAALLQVNAIDIEQICKERLKLDGDEVLNPQESQALAAAVRQLHGIEEAAAESGGQPPILDPEKDLKINQLDLVTAIRERQTLMQVGMRKPGHASFAAPVEHAHS